MPPRRKRRSAEVRNSLRLFGLLAVLAGVNVYVFFFNRGTAPREVLKPSSMVRGIDGRAGVLNAATGEATTAAGLAESDSFAIPTATIVNKKSLVPVPIGPASPGQAQLKPGKPKPTVATGGAPPKALPGGNPGLDTAGPPPQASEPSDGQAPGPQDPVEKTFTEAETLGQVLAREGFDAESVRVVAALSRFIDPKMIRGGHTYAVRVNDHGEPESFEYRPNPVTRVVATRAPSGSWVATRVDQPLEMKVASVSGTVESTLYESVQNAGEKGALVGLLVDLLAWDVNFYTDTHPGDHWKVIVEKQLLGGQFYRYGHILAAEYGGRVGTFRSFYWQPPTRTDATGAYYDEKGQAISKTLLKTPLRYVRVSSKFDRHRFHPILHRERAHLGIDYAAPVGTPVWASSGGKVVECEMKRGSGNTVVLGHANGLTTRYYHLSRFARGLRRGRVVKQKEVIGFVGTTGLSTGPHLHFSVTKNGAFVDPNKVQINRAPAVADRGAFIAAIKPRVAILQALEPGALARN